MVNRETFLDSVKSLLFHTAFAALVYVGFIEGVGGAANVVTFLAWGFFVPVSLVCLNGVTIERIAKKPPGYAVVSWIQRLNLLVCLTIVLWQGAWGTSIALGIAIVALAIGAEATKKKRAALAEAA